MKSTIRNKEQTEELTYPCLMEYCGEMESNGFIIFVGIPDEYTNFIPAFVVHSNDPERPIGFAFEDVDLEQFKHFDATIELSN